MAPHVTESEFKLLRDLIYSSSGIFLSDNKAYLIEARLADLVAQSRCATFGELYLKAKSSAESEKLCSLIVDAITTNETSWFRDHYPYQVLKERLLPEFDRQMKAGMRNRINIWSAACSTGQEPYSIAMTVLDFYGDSHCDSACHNWVQILATDISPSSLALAAEGAYDTVSIHRGLQQKHLDHYFRKSKNGSTWTVDERIKKMVVFQPCNLKRPSIRAGSFDVVFLRNVMIYFPDGLKRELLDGVATSLAPNGYLFLGTGETVSGYTTRFEMLEWQRAAFYRVKAALRETKPIPGRL